MTKSRADIRLSSRDSARRCSVCHGSLSEDQSSPTAPPAPAAVLDLVDTKAIWSCPECATALHTDCRAELRGCPTLGCRGGAGGDRLEAMPADARMSRWTALRQMLRRSAGVLCLLISVLGTAAVTFILGIVACLLIALLTSGEAIRSQELFTLLLSATVLGSLGMATRSGFRELGESLLERARTPGAENPHAGGR